MSKEIAIVFDPNNIDRMTGEFQRVMVVVPDTDGQLNDPAWYPDGMVHIRMSKQEYIDAGRLIKGHKAITDKIAQATLDLQLTGIRDQKRIELSQKISQEVAKAALDASLDIVKNQ